MKHLFLLALTTSLLMMGCKTESSKEIDRTCSNCEKKKLPKTSFILVTNQEGKSNVFNIKTMKYMLSNWYPAVFDEGVIYDDITFTVTGREVSCSESEYHLLSDKYLNKFDEEIVNIGSTKKSSQSEWIVCKNCTGKSCTHCFGRGYYYHYSKQ